MVAFLDTLPPATVAELNELEQYAGLTFPELYRQHLLLYNGGKCEPNVFHFIENGNSTSSMVDSFLPTRQEGWGSLRDYIETYKIDEKRLPSFIIPIADDPGGNLICISCEQGDLGSIYFWDHETEVDYTVEEDSVRTNLYRISNSLHEFLTSLVGRVIELDCAFALTNQLYRFGILIGLVSQ